MEIFDTHAGKESRTWGFGTVFVCCLWRCRRCQWHNVDRSERLCAARTGLEINIRYFAVLALGRVRGEIGNTDGAKIHFKGSAKHDIECGGKHSYPVDSESDPKNLANSRPGYNRMVSENIGDECKIAEQGLTLSVKSFVMRWSLAGTLNENMMIQVHSAAPGRDDLLECHGSWMVYPLLGTVDCPWLTFVSIGRSLEAD